MDGHMHTSAHTCVHTYTHTHSMHKQIDTYKRIATLGLCLIGDADLRKYHSTMGGTDEIQWCIVISTCIEGAASSPRVIDDRAIKLIKFESNHFQPVQHPASQLPNPLKNEAQDLRAAL